MNNRTLTMIKPDAMSKGYAGAILDKIIKGGFRVVALKQTNLPKEKAGEFYAVHKERLFYGELVEFMSSGPIIAAILEKENAVVDFRKLIGATDPAAIVPERLIDIVPEVMVCEAESPLNTGVAFPITSVSLALP